MAVPFNPNSHAATCTATPIAVHPEFSRSTPMTRNVNAAHTCNIAFADEIGHFEFCAKVGADRLAARAEQPPARPQRGRFRRERPRCRCRLLRLPKFVTVTKPCQKTSQGRGDSMAARETSEVFFRKIDNTDLSPVAVVAQCLDNQWVPRDLLATMVERGWSLNHEDVARRRLENSRHEYLRSILNSQQVIVNRAFFFNNSVVYRDFLHPGQARTAFTELLGTAVIIPYLFKETSPAQDQVFTVQDRGWQAWQEVIGETSTSCLRLSWNDDDNSDYTRLYLEKPFRRFLLSMADFEEEGLKRDFSLSDERASQLRARLREVAQWALDSEKVTREEFYRAFVVADGTHPADGWYDRGKPFADQLKQLADLRYNTILADAMDRYALTPADSLHRAALQEERRFTRAVGVDTEGLLEVLLRRRAFDLVQSGLDIGLAGLDLHHVWQARKTDEWASYIASLRALIEAPQEFERRGQDVYTQYVNLGRRLSEIVGSRRQGIADRWEPIILLTVETLGSVISIVFGRNPYVEVTGKVAREIAGRASTALVRFAIVGRDQRRASTQLGTSVDLMKVRFRRTAEDWGFLIAKLSEAGLPQGDTLRQPEMGPNLDVPEESEENA